jgi:hypothetical protein
VPTAAHISCHGPLGLTSVSSDRGAAYRGELTDFGFHVESNAKGSDHRDLAAAGGVDQNAHVSHCIYSVRGLGRRSRLSAIAFTATITLEADIEIAPTSGRRMKPNGSKMPAAMGIASEL